MCSVALSSLFPIGKIDHFDWTSFLNLRQVASSDDVMTFSFFEISDFSFSLLVGIMKNSPFSDIVALEEGLASEEFVAHVTCPMLADTRTFAFFWRKAKRHITLNTTERTVLSVTMQPLPQSS